MNRRDFLKLIGKTIVIATAPINVNLANTPHKELTEGVKITAKLFDYDRVLGVAVEFVHNGETILNGVRIGVIESLKGDLAPIITDHLNEFLKKYNRSVPEGSVEIATYKLKGFNI